MTGIFHRMKICSSDRNIHNILFIMKSLQSLPCCIICNFSALSWRVTFYSALQDLNLIATSFYMQYWGNISRNSEVFASEFLKNCEETYSKRKVNYWIGKIYLTDLPWWYCNSLTSKKNTCKINMQNTHAA